MEHTTLSNGNQLWQKGDESLLLTPSGRWELAKVSHNGSVVGLPVGLSTEEAHDILRKWGVLRDLLTERVRVAEEANAEAQRIAEREHDLLLWAVAELQAEITRERRTV